MGEGAEAEKKFLAPNGVDPRGGGLRRLFLAMFHANGSDTRIRVCLYFDLDRAAGDLSVTNRNGGCGGRELVAVVWRVTSKAYRLEPSGGGHGVVLTEALWDVAAGTLVKNLREKRALVTGAGRGAEGMGWRAPSVPKI